jgi:hypothetical protein
MSKRFSGSNPDRLDDEIESRLAELRAGGSPWEWSDLIERGRLAVAEGDLGGACSTFEMAVQASGSADERVISRYYWGTSLIASAQALGGSEKSLIGSARSLVAGDTEEDPRRLRMVRVAADVLNEAQRSSPMSRDVAAARVMAWSMLEDELETLAAEHQLRVIDPSTEGKARSSLASAASIVMAVCKAGSVVLRTFDFEKFLTPDQRAGLLQILDQGAAGAEMAVSMARAKDVT